MEYKNTTNTNLHIMPHVVISPGHTIELSRIESENSMIAVLVRKGWLQLVSEIIPSEEPVIEKNSSVDFIGHNLQPEKPQAEVKLEPKTEPLKTFKLGTLEESPQQEEVELKAKTEPKSKRYKKLDSVLDEALSKAKIEDEPVMHAKRQEVSDKFLEDAIAEAEGQKHARKPYSPADSMAPLGPNDDEFFHSNRPIQKHEYGNREEPGNFNPLALSDDGSLYQLGELTHHVKDTDEE